MQFGVLRQIDVSSTGACGCGATKLESAMNSPTLNIQGAYATPLAKLQILYRFRCRVVRHEYTACTNVFMITSTRSSSFAKVREHKTATNRGERCDSG